MWRYVGGREGQALHSIADIKKIAKSFVQRLLRRSLVFNRTKGELHRDCAAFPGIDKILRLQVPPKIDKVHKERLRILFHSRNPRLSTLEIAPLFGGNGARPCTHMR